MQIIIHNTLLVRIHLIILNSISLGQVVGRFVRRFDFKLQDIIAIYDPL
jgi:hypothetical protein